MDNTWEAVETDDNEERGDIAMALRDSGFTNEADDAGGETVENARTLFEETTGKPWNWGEWAGGVINK